MIRSPLRLALSLAFVFASLNACIGEGPPAPVKPEAHGGVPPAGGSHLLDVSYGGHGSSGGFPTPEATGVFKAVATDRFDRVLVTGVRYSTPDGMGGIVLERFDTAGRLDPSFGTGGMALGEGEYKNSEMGLSVSLDAFDRILVAGHVVLSDPDQFYSKQHGAVFRFLDDGSLDTTFGEQGRVLVDLEYEDWTAGLMDVAADGSGNVLLLGLGRAPDEDPWVDFTPHMFVARLLEDGSLDESFGLSGVAYGPEEEPSWGTALAVDELGRPLVTGYVGMWARELAVWRFQADGLPDLSFGGASGGGIVVRGGVGGDQATSMVGADIALDSLGRVLVAGNHASEILQLEQWPSLRVWPKGGYAPIFDAVVWRFEPDGGLDLTFGNGGWRAVNLESGDGDHFDVATSLVIDPADGVILTGYSARPSWDAQYGIFTYGPTQIAVTRLSEAGGYDPSFNGVGHAVFGLARADGLALDGQGRIVLAGIGQHVGAMTWRLTP